MKTHNRLLSLLLFLFIALNIHATGASGMFQYSVSLTRYISPETGQAPTAYLWVPEHCDTIKAVMLAQQNMTEEQLYKMPSFQKAMKRLHVALLWVAPAFSQKWDPATSCQTTFEEMMTAMAFQSGHMEIAKAPIIPFGHSAQATFPWNFAAWNPNRTLCIISFHGDAPRTNLCGFGTSNVEWGRTRNINGIPGLMIEGEYEWWEARVRPALAFRMMYPESCISFLCDTGHGHFDCAEKTAGYIAKFIEKSLKARLQSNGTLKKVNPQDGWLAERYHPDIMGTDGADKGKMPALETSRPAPAPFAEYKGDPHDAFWYFDREMAELTEARYRETRGKAMQYVGFMDKDKLIPYNDRLQGGMQWTFVPSSKKLIFSLKPVYTDATHNTLSDKHGTGRLHIEVISGPVKKIGDNTFEVYPYEAGWDNPHRSFCCWLVAVAEPDGKFKGAVQPLQVVLPKDIILKGIQ